MTLNVMVWALNDAPVDDAQQKLILVAMADNARANGRNCWLSQASIAAKACCSVRTVHNHLTAMEAAGVIRRGDQSAVPDYIPANRRPVVWDLMIDVVHGADAPPEDQESVDNPVDSVAGKICRPASDPPQAGKMTRSDRQPVADKPKTNQEINRKRSTSRDERLLASLRAEQPRPAPECPHGVKPWRCPQC